MPTTKRTYEIFQGTTQSAADTVTLVSIGSAGDPSAKRRLTHPNSEILPITYFTNPDRTFNLDNEVLISPTVNVVKTEGGTKVVRFEGSLEDAIITEIWSARQGQFASMPTFFFRQLYEYWINPPAFDATSPVFIQWEPRDRSDKKYNVELTRLVVGGGAENNQLYDVSDIRQPSGNFKGPLDDLDDLVTGVVDRTVLLQMRIVSEA